MAKIRLLVDTDILIDYLKKIKPAKALFDSNDADLYCSILSKKELLTKPGLSSSERKKIVNLLLKIKIPSCPILPCIATARAHLLRLPNGWKTDSSIFQAVYN